MSAPASTTMPTSSSFAGYTTIIYTTSSGILSAPSQTTGLGSSASCPTDSASFCATSDQQTLCSDDNGATYNVTCGAEFEGSATGDPTTKKVKRTTEPTFQACQNLCDATADCVAFNYMGTNCTMLSSVTGSISVPGAVAATQLSPPTTSSAPASTDPVCPGSANTMYTDSSNTTYGVGCYTDYAGNTIGSPIDAASFAACLPFCDSMVGCVGVVFNTAYSLCYLKSSFGGIQTSDTSAIYGMRNRAAPGGSISPSIVMVTPTSTTTLCKLTPVKALTLLTLR